MIRFALAVLMFVASGIVWADEPAKKDAPPKLTEAEEEELVQKFVKLSAEVKRLRANGEAKKALPGAHEASSLVERLLGSGHPSHIQNLGGLAEIQEEAGDCSGSIETRKRMLAMIEKQQGANHHETVKARWNLKDAERFQELTDEKRQELLKAKQLNRQGVAELKQGRPDRAPWIARLPDCSTNQSTCWVA
jgi:hypothetical protein